MLMALPNIPAKRYFTIGEVSDLCAVKPYVLRYWEQEFTQLKPVKRRGNRRYYQHHEVLLIRRIRELLYDQGFTISGARNQLGDLAPVRATALSAGIDVEGAVGLALDLDPAEQAEFESHQPSATCQPAAAVAADGAGRLDLDPATLRAELMAIRQLLVS